ncbi:hypothetical protein ABK040_007704 [Willaertia magna]
MDHFLRFQRSIQLKNFLLKKGEDFTRAISIDASKGFKVDIRYNPQDFKTPHLSERDIYFALTVAEDSPDWEVIYEKTKVVGKQLAHCTTYTSKTHYIIGNSNTKGMRLGKIVMDLPFHVRDVFATFSDKEGLRHDNMLVDDLHTHAIEEIDLAKNKPISFSKTSFGVNLAKFMKMRDFTFVQTFVHDQKYDCLINVAKPAEFEERPIRKDRVKGEMIFCHLFYNVCSNRTRYVHVWYVDLDLFIEKDIIFKALSKKRGKDLFKYWPQLLDEVTESGKKPKGK